MSNDDFFAAALADLVRVDWKTLMVEALAEMRHKWGGRHAFLYSEELDKLAENQTGESSYEQFTALGQELTVHGFHLYSIDEGSDEYCFALIPLEQEKPFEKWLKKNRQNAELLKQPRKKSGVPATRAKIAGRLALKDIISFSAPKSQFTTFFKPQKLALRVQCNFSSQGGLEGRQYAWLDMSVWPPAEYPSKHLVSKAEFSASGNVWAISRATGTDEGELWITDSPISPTFERRVDFPEIPGWREKRAEDPSWQYYNADAFHPQSNLCWIGEDLLFTHEYRVKPGCTDGQIYVWLVRGAATNASPKAEKISVCPYVSDFSARFSKSVTTAGGDSLIRIGGRFYRWQNEELLDTGFKSTGDFNPALTGKHRFAFINGGSQLVEYDTRANKARTRPMPGNYANFAIINVTENIVAFTGRNIPPSSEDAGILWNTQNDEWLRLPYGALGSSGLADVMALSGTK